MILLLGYWPPTNVDGMLAKYKKRRTVTHDGKTYDVLALSAAFTKLGTYPPLTFDEDYYGKGTATGDAFTVDYLDTSNKFWRLVEKHRPIAIMSFSRWKFNTQWALDKWATNWARDDWFIRLDYKDLLGNDTWTDWDKPYIGAGTGDPAPPSVDQMPRPGDPPDPTRDAGTKRTNNLPLEAIEAAIDPKFTDAQLDPWLNDVEGPGRFVSNFLAYHVVWYREWWDVKNSDPKLKCLKSGHTHVGGKITVANAADALDIQLKELFKVLPETK